MTRHSLNLPQQPKRDAEQRAVKRGALNQFILWSVAERVGECKQQLDDTAFPRITYRHGANGSPVAVLRGTGIRVQTVVTAAHDWQLPSAEVVAEYGISETQVAEALAFYQHHRQEIDAALAAEDRLEEAGG